MYTHMPANRYTLAYFLSGTPCIIPGNIEVHDLVTLGRVIWVIDTIRTRLHVRAHTTMHWFTGATDSRMWGKKVFLLFLLFCDERLSSRSETMCVAKISLFFR